MFLHHSRHWTFVDQKTFAKAGSVELLEVMIKAADKPFNVGIYRPTADGSQCSYRLVRQLKFNGLSKGYHKVNILVMMHYDEYSIFSCNLYLSEMGLTIFTNKVFFKCNLSIWESPNNTKKNVKIKIIYPNHNTLPSSTV